MSTLPEQLHHWVERQPEATALVSPDGALSYGELWLAANALADVIHAAGLRRLGVCGDNSPAWVIADLACLLADVVCVPVPGFFSRGQKEHLVAKAGLEGLLWGPGESALPGMTRLTDRAWLQALPVSADPPAIPAGTAKITFTSGSTGTPKGVCLSASHLAATTIALRQRLVGVPLRRHLSVLPLATLLENVGGVYLPLAMGAQVELLPLAALGMAGSSQLDAGRLVTTLGRTRPDSLILVPEQAAMLVTAAEQGLLDGRAFRFLAVGGGKVSPELLARSAAVGLPLYEGYGLSECGSVVALNVPGAARVGAVGKLLNHVRVAINEDNEICISGNTHLGYLGEGPVTGDFLATGDLGRLDGDGYLHVEGRRKNLLITGFGRNISPEWLESELAHAADASQVLVFGDGEPHPRALLTIADGRSAEAVRVAVVGLNRRLPDYARLGDVYLRHWPLSRAAGHVTANGRLVRSRILDDLPVLLAGARRLTFATVDQSDPEGTQGPRCPTSPRQLLSSPNNSKREV